MLTRITGDFANVLADDLTARGAVDAAGAWWSDNGHLATLSDLEPRAWWAMGTARSWRVTMQF
jgi:hypothetical protein